MRYSYSNTITDFIKDNEDKILGELTRSFNFSLEDLQKNAWLSQIKILKNQLASFPDGHVFFEFSIPRMGKRVDNIIIINDLIFVVEFKVGAIKYENYAIEQVLDYSLDLKNFHEGSHDTKLIPLLVSTRSPEKENKIIKQDDNLYSVVMANENNLKDIINLCLQESESQIIDPIKWCNSIYKPTPTIIEAAQALYRGHDVKEISRSDSGAINLSKTTDCLNKIINSSKINKRKSICFITGVPGAGKTLAGLNIANERMKSDENEHAVFLSGNGPLVVVLREALTRDNVRMAKKQNIKITKKEAAIKSNAFIQNIHHFRDDNLNLETAPIERVVVFDEAQRAWTKKQTASFMQRKKGVSDFSMSEPEFLISVMNRHQDWCVLICLIGGGQEINTGEAGLEEWMVSLKNHYSNWDIYCSDAVVSDKNYIQNSELDSWIFSNCKQESDLHLSVSIRSFRSEKLSDFIQALLELNVDRATNIYCEIKNNYPLFITRDFNTAKKWLISKTRGSERSGIIASSGGRRLMANGIDVKSGVSIEDWFLNGKNDVRSSMFLESVATEFDIQGLEIDWTCVAWDGNLYFDGTNWCYQNFKGTKWQSINNSSNKKYLLNSYRVLLTRARQGMIIYVPFGSAEDHTRPCKYYDQTFEYFKNIGIKEI